ncbi:hypothetical protein OF001_U220044 [Pseudomonas sp. OF001]|nr:hypothetical protein OF001_U220044 [Pseudomonas sp. OF001]
MVSDGEHISLAYEPAYGEGESGAIYIQ